MYSMLLRESHLHRPQRDRGLCRSSVVGQLLAHLDIYVLLGRTRGVFCRKRVAGGEHLSEEFRHSCNSGDTGIIR